MCGDPLKAACQLWYFGEVEGGTTQSLIANLLPLWSRLAARNQAEARAQDSVEMMSRAKRRSQDLIEDSSSRQAAFMAAEVAMWCTWATWHIWSFSVASKHSGSKIVQESRKQDQYSKLIYASKEADQIWNIFLQAC